MSDSDAIKTAAKNMDWQQVVLNGGPPCFHLEEDRRFCGRAERWQGHGQAHHFVSLEGLVGDLQQTVATFEAALRGEQGIIFPDGYEVNVAALRLEIERLKDGRFTPEEFQNLCHNLSEDDAAKFRKGCIEYQEKLFGKAQDTVWIKGVQLRRIGDYVQVLVELADSTMKLCIVEHVEGSFSHYIHPGGIAFAQTVEE